MRAEFEQQDIEMIAQKVAEILKSLVAETAKNEDDIILTLKELAQYLKVGEQWVYQKVYQRSIPFYKIGKYTRFRKSEIDQWLQENGNGNNKKPPNKIRRLLN